MVLLVFVYGIEKIFLGIALDKKDVILSFFFGGMIISGEWYLQVQLVLYIMWFLVYRSFENWKFRRYIVLIGEIVFCLVMRGFGYSTVWYESVLAFYLGIAWADNENWIVKIINNKWRKASALVLGLFIFNATFDQSRKSEIEIVATSCKICAALIFVSILTIIACNVPFQNKVTSFLGKISFEIYIVQFMFILLFRSRLVYIDEAIVYVAVVFVTTMLGAIAIEPVVSTIFDRCRQYKKYIN